MRTVTSNMVPTQEEIPEEGKEEKKIIKNKILYALFVSLLFDNEKLTCYADDKFPLVWARDKAQLVLMMLSKNQQNH